MDQSIQRFEAGPVGEDDVRQGSAVDPAGIVKNGATACRIGGLSSASRARASASTTAQPSLPNWAATRLFPDAIPPTIPITGLCLLRSTSAVRMRTPQSLWYGTNRRRPGWPGAVGSHLTLFCMARICSSGTLVPRRLAVLT